jgi:hypothetical protein
MAGELINTEESINVSSEPSKLAKNTPQDDIGAIPSDEILKAALIEHDTKMLNDIDLSTAEHQTAIGVGTETQVYRFLSDCKARLAELKNMDKV